MNQKLLNIFTRSSFFLLLMIVMSSCYNYKELRLLQEKSKLIPDYAKAEYSDYKIRVNDEIIYRLITSDESISKIISPQNTMGSSQNQMSYRVFPDGTIDLPFVDSIKVAGLTQAEAAVHIENRLKRLIPDAVVKLSLANKTFTVFGDIGSGSFPIYKDKLTIYQALSMVGDFDYGSDRRHVKIIRETDKGTEILNFDIRPKSVIDSKYYYVYPNDIIYVRREFSSFYKVSNYSALLGVINFSVSLLFNALIYVK